MRPIPLNPLIKARDARGWERPAFASVLGVRYASLYALENGFYTKLPESWRVPLQQAGMDFDALAGEYRAYRLAKSGLAA